MTRDENHASEFIGNLIKCGVTFIHVMWSRVNRQLPEDQSLLMTKAYIAYTLLLSGWITRNVTGTIPGLCKSAIA